MTSAHSQYLAHLNKEIDSLESKLQKLKKLAADVAAVNNGFQQLILDQAQTETNEQVQTDLKPNIRPRLSGAELLRAKKQNDKIREWANNQINLKGFVTKPELMSKFPHKNYKDISNVMKRYQYYPATQKYTM